VKNSSPEKSSVSGGTGRGSENRFHQIEKILLIKKKKKKKKKKKLSEKEEPFSEEKITAKKFWTFRVEKKHKNLKKQSEGKNQ